ncbi:dihydrodipicolinate synthase family protein [Pokkaliibacter plantistimulans]|uniref:Dihydrodipicolinate synthase family protein n=1 Tax=Proteobacteria bacterium 228 TaxID=2083153 RepID=A0A2S5KM92_9PROT|nr:dihydrodipicolinate synthase family protein [Pokkaliibacter plantistimulans]PPC75832.1 dihydrodipicolinate synthase family protein [Pokkaliibacter plantistimulans]
MHFEGIYTPVITPFRENGEIDFDAYAAHVQYLIDSGVHGLMIGGTTGEYYVESHEERVELLKVARQLCSDKQTIIFGTGSLDPRASIRLAEDAAKYEADCLLVATPPYSLPTQRELALHALSIDRAANLPVMLYNYPARMGIDMEAEFLDRVGSSSNFCGIKESSGDINRLHMLARDYPHIQLACGMDDQALEFFAWGAKSWVCAGSNFLPQEHLALYRACVLENDFRKARRIMSAMLPLMRVLEQGGKFIQSVKYGVTLDGRFAGEVRRPLCGLNEADKRALEQVIKTLRITIAAIEAEGSQPVSAKSKATKVEG